MSEDITVLCPLLPRRFHSQKYKRIIIFSGTPFLSEIMWLIHNDADLEAARSTFHGVRVKFMEHILAEGNPLDILAQQPSPRLLKTHLPAHFFTKQLQTKGMKFIIMIRNPKDMLVSFFKFYTADRGYVRYKGDWNDFFEIFKAEQLFGGDWFEHAQSWWKLRHRDDVMIVQYENIRQRPRDFIERIAQHCGKAVPPTQVDIIVKYIMKEVPEESAEGVWKDYFTVSQNEYFDRLYQDKLGHSGLKLQDMHR